MATAIAGRELSDTTFFPVYEAIEAAGLPVLLHPNSVIGHERLTPHYLHNLLGNPFETAIAAAHLIFGGVLDRFPRLTFCLPHAGGAFPYLVGRLQRGFEKRPGPAGRTHGPLEYLRRFYYDTISYHAPALDYLKNLVGADRVMMGSDYCFPIALERPVEVVTGHAGFTADEQGLIVEETRGGCSRCSRNGLARALRRATAAARQAPRERNNRTLAAGTPPAPRKTPAPVPGRDGTRP